MTRDEDRIPNYPTSRNGPAIGPSRITNPTGMAVVLVLLVVVLLVVVAVT